MSVFVIRSNLLMFDYVFFFPLSKNACIYLAPPLPFWNRASELSERLHRAICGYIVLGNVPK